MSLTEDEEWDELDARIVELNGRVVELTAQRDELAAMLATCECAIRAAIGMGFDTKGFRDLLDKLCVLREGQPK